MLKVECAVLCEDVRQEFNGKQIIIGVFTGDVLVASFPATLRVVYWMPISNVEKGRNSIHYRIHDGRDSVFADFNLTFDAAEGADQQGALSTVPATVVANGPSNIILSIEENGQWVDKLIKRVQFFPQPPQ